MVKSITAQDHSVGTGRAILFSSCGSARQHTAPGGNALIRQLRGLETLVHRCPTDLCSPRHATNRQKTTTMFSKETTMQASVTSATLTLPELDDLVDQFEADVQADPALTAIYPHPHPLPATPVLYRLATLLVLHDVSRVYPMSNVVSFENLFFCAGTARAPRWPPARDLRALWPFSLRQSAVAAWA